MEVLGHAAAKEGDHVPNTRRRRTVLLALAVLPGVLFMGQASAGTNAGADRSPATPAAPAVAASLKKASGRVDVVVQLTTDPVAKVAAAGGSRAAQKDQASRVATQQQAVGAAAAKLGAVSQASLDTSLNALVLSIDAGQIGALAATSGVKSINPVRTYQTAADDPDAKGLLSLAADYLHATQVRAAGFDGAGVNVAVLDSGIDYTHANLGGPGTVAAYNTCYGAPTKAYDKAPTGICAGLFGPSAPKVKGGFDFIGEVWPNGDRTEDPNPIDFDGHGTHVSDIIGGHSADGSHLGIAPGVNLYAVRVCSAVSTACNGVSLLKAVDWILDPNGDKSTDDHMDIANLSLGSDYGQREDDLTVALENAVDAGIVVLTAAGNGGDMPFKVSSPSIGSNVISVAETALPDNVLLPIYIDGQEFVRFAVPQPWAPFPTSAVSGPLTRPSVSTGCSVGDFSNFKGGEVALIDRGICNITVKVDNAREKGAVAAIIVNNRAGNEPPSFSFGGGNPDIPTVSVSQASGVKLRTVLGHTATLDPDKTVPLVGTMVGTSSRGPTVDGAIVKPDLGAPGAWFSAEVGTGNENTNFGGTSGATPTVSGVAALLLQQQPAATPLEIKARLLSTATVGNESLDANGVRYPSPISRIGSGEVRASLTSGAAILTDVSDDSGNLSLGLHHLTAGATVTKTLNITNTAAGSRTFTLVPTFRDPADQALGAVSVSFDTGATVTVAGGATQLVTATFTVDPTKLNATPAGWRDAGHTGADGTVLNGPEIDGYLLLQEAGATVAHLGWQVLPLKSAAVTAPASVTTANGSAQVTLSNTAGLVPGKVQVFTLMGTDPDDVTPGADGKNAATVDLKAVGIRNVTANVSGVAIPMLQIAVAGWDRNATPLYPAGIEIDIDVNRDGKPDVAFFNEESLGFGASGVTLVQRFDVGSGDVTTVGVATAAFDSGNIVYTIPLGALGKADKWSADCPGLSYPNGYLNGPARPAAGHCPRELSLVVLGYDNYFTGTVTDFIVGSGRWDPTTAGVTASASSVTVPAGGTANLDVTKQPGAGTGLLLLADDAATNEALTISVS